MQWTGVNNFIVSIYFRNISRPSLFSKALIQQLGDIFPGALKVSVVWHNAIGSTFSYFIKDEYKIKQTVIIIIS